MASSIELWLTRQTSLGRWKRQLERATTKLSFNTFLGIHMGIMMAVYLTVLFITRDNHLSALLFALLSAFVPRFYTIMVIGNRITRFKNQLPDTVTIWVNALRSGSSVLQGMESISRNASEPSSSEFQRVLQEVQFGVGMEEALNNLLNRVDDQDLDFIITSVNIQREVGGNLAEILDTIAQTIRERIKLTRELAIQVKARYRIFFLVAVLMTVLQWAVFERYFSGAMIDSLSGQLALFITYTAIALTFYASVGANHRLRSLNISADNTWLIDRDNSFDFLVGTTLILIALTTNVPLTVILWLVLLLIFTVRRYAWIALILALLVGATMIFSPYDIPDLPNLLADGVAIQDGVGSAETILNILLTITVFIGVNSLTVFIVGVGLRILTRVRSARDTSDPLVERLATYHDDEIGTLEDVRESTSFRISLENRVLNTISGLLLRLTPESIIEANRRVIGYENPLPYSHFRERLLWVLGFAMLGGLIGFVILRDSIFIGLGYIIMGGLIGFFLPIVYRRNRIRRNKESITNSLPDAIDLMTVCMEAGLGFDGAMAKIYEKWDNTLADNFGRVIREIQLGKKRRDALQAMATRLDVPDVSTFISAIIQSDQLGVPIVRTLQVQSNQMRSNWKQTFEGQVENYNLILDYFSLFLFAPAVNLWLIAPIIAQYFG